MFDGFERRKIEVEGAVINTVFGGAGPPLLLLHGYPQTHAMWAHIATILADNFTVVATDLRGYGDSSKPKCVPGNDNYSFRAMAQDQVSVMRALGHESFHVAGHDRGGRTAHRMALDHPDIVRSLAVLDIVPTFAMFMDTNRHVAGGYWHWYFLSQPEPFPEHMIGLDPDFFFETCLVGWGKTKIADFDPEQISEYRRCWRDPGMIQGSCSDYRAAATIDLVHDGADIDAKVLAPALVVWGADGLMARMFDMEVEWRKRLANMIGATLPGGHFFPDHLPKETAGLLGSFFRAQSQKV
ncbi:MAG: alpha/beta fold hydrolase [Hyphomicrobium sp.]